MIICERSFDQHGSGKHLVVLLFGTGLIGGEILNQLENNDFTSQALEYDWCDKSIRQEHAYAIVNYVNYLFKTETITKDQPYSRWLSIVWAAGKGGFAAKKQVLTQEFCAFQAVVEIARKLHKFYPNAHHAFHLISSAGGLFEGQRNVGIRTVPDPKRDYGYLKLQQEDLLQSLDRQINKFCYRPSSVYGLPIQGKRLGLIPTLILNGLQRREVNFYGRMDTLRDYVLNTEVADFIVNKMLSCTTKGGTFNLAAARPTSLHELKTVVEGIIGNKIYARYDMGLTNAAHITFDPSSLPNEWATVDLHTGVRQVFAQFFRSRGQR